MLSKPGSIAALILSQIAVLAVWFSSAAVLSEMSAEAGLAPSELAWLSTAVQLGFGVGAVVYGGLGVADRFDPRVVFALSAALSAACNLALLAVPVGGTEAIALRGLTGAFLAGVYPVGMKIAVGWTKANRALLVSALVGALTLGSASPHLVAWWGGADWRVTIQITSALAALGGAAILAVRLGPYHARAPRLDLGAVAMTWRVREIRLAVLAYIGHMWELYVFWAWIGVILAASFAEAGHPDAELVKLVSFVAVAAGGVICIPAGILADRIGKARVAGWIMALSAVAALAAAASFGGPVWLFVTVMIVWGVLVVPDSALFSALVADGTPPERAGTVMTVQTALGFLLTAVTVQLAPVTAEALGWPVLLAMMGIGPALGVLAMRALARR